MKIHIMVSVPPCTLEPSPESPAAYQVLEEQACVTTSTVPEASPEPPRETLGEAIPPHLPDGCTTESQIGCIQFQFWL